MFRLTGLTKDFVQSAQSLPSHSIKTDKPAKHSNAIRQIITLHGRLGAPGLIQVGCSDPRHVSQ
ncbi:MAG TPA: hypothetical protein DIT96_03610 [Pseudomonas sp.]|nr:hypothetical protein [Pseudomonas sp.]